MTFISISLSHRWIFPRVDVADVEEPLHPHLPGDARQACGALHVDVAVAEVLRLHGAAHQVDGDVGVGQGAPRDGE